MNVFKLWCAAMVCIFTVASCSNEDLESLPQENRVLETKSMISEVELSTVAQLLASIEIDQAIMDEVKEGVDQSQKYGLDEEYRFADMTKPELSKVRRSTQMLSLIQKMNDKLETQSGSLRSSMTKAGFFENISDNDLQVYWPYSANWNGTDNPIVLYGIENDKLACIPVSLADGSLRMDTISVTTEFLKENTVWVISKNDIPYDELPDFENGEFVNKDGVFYYSKYATDKLTKNRAKQPGVYIGAINTLESHEGTLAGGPEFDLTWCHAGPTIDINAAPVGYVNKYRVTFTKKEVGQPKQIDYPIQPTWKTTQITNALLIYESDGGKNKVGTRTLTYKALSGKMYSVPVQYSYEANDDNVLDMMFERSKIYGDDNKAADGSWKQYKGANFWVTLPVVPGGIL